MKLLFTLKKKKGNTERRAADPTESKRSQYRQQGEMLNCLIHSNPMKSGSNPICQKQD